MRRLIQKLSLWWRHLLTVLDFRTPFNIVIKLSGQGCVASLAGMMRCALLKGMRLVRIVSTPEPLVTLQLSPVHV